MINPVADAAIPFVGSGFVGYIMGYAVRKIIKWVMVIAGVTLGAFFTGVYIMQARGYLTGTINWDKIGNDLSNATSTFILNAQNGSYNSQLSQIVHQLGIPVATGLGMGFVVGFLRTK